MKLGQYFWNKIFPVILAALLGFIFGDVRKSNEITELKKEIQSLKNQMPEIPITVIDPATKNQLYIGRPIKKLTYYEFPITLNDGRGSYRIDQYNLLNKYSGKLIVIKESAD